MKIGWNGETLPALPLEEEFPIVAQAGYDGLELFIPKLGAFLEQKGASGLASAFAETGLTPLTMNGIENINLRPADQFAQVKADCRWLAELSMQIGCPCIVVVPSPNPTGLPWGAVRDQTVQALRDLACLAAPFGVKLGLEFLAPVDSSVRTLTQAWEIIQATDRENVGLVIDTYHFVVGGSAWESLELFDIDRLFIVHLTDVEDRPPETLTDGDRLLPGEGILPLTRIVSRLEARGYRGACSLEVMRPAYRQRQPQEYARAGWEAVRCILSAAGAS